MVDIPIVRHKYFSLF